MKSNKRIKLPSITLPEEMCIEILSRLPVKPLLKFRSVSKVWCSLIDSPHFTSTHLINCQNNQENSRLLVIEPPDMVDDEQKCTIRRADKFRRTSCYGLDVTWFEHYQVVGYINGVICMKKYMNETQLCEIFLWNPSLKKSLQLPLPRVRNSTSVKVDVDFIFGFDPVRNDYKVVTTVYTTGGIHVPEFVGLYTLSEGSWRRISIEKGPCSWSKVSPKVFLNGVTYWAGIDLMKTSIQYGKCTHFVSFNACNDVFSYIELPAFQDVRTSVQQRLPVVLRQSIGLMEIFRTQSYIWVMKEFGVTTSWTKQYSINIQLFDKFLHLKPNGDVLFREEEEGVNSYNIESQETAVLAKSYKLTPVFTDIYMESLVLSHQVNGRPLLDFPVPKTRNLS